MPDAVVVGAGPNGLAAALTLAEAGLGVQVFESAPTPGGGLRSAELTLPGFRHDVCATVLAMSATSPFLRSLDLDSLGVRIRKPAVAYAHPLDDGRAVAAYEDVEHTAAELGVDRGTWRRLFAPLVRDVDRLVPDVLGNLRRLPRHPLSMARFGLPGLLPVTKFAPAVFRDERSRALFAGLGAHSGRRLSASLTSAFGMVLALSAHVGGWPVVEGGMGSLADALVCRLGDLGVEISCEHTVRSLSDLPSADATLLDVTPRQLLRLAGDLLPGNYRRRLHRFRYGPGVFKIDYALSGPVPWTAEICRSAGTVHVGGTLDEVADSEAAVESGRYSDRPFVLVVQPTVADPSRAPAGGHTLWAYCHVPNGSALDRTNAIENQIERFAPGFRDLVLARFSRSAVDYEHYDANFVGGDINGARAGLHQTLLGPTRSWSRYRTPLAGVYLCSASTAPGGGIHGMCGVNAARETLSREFR